MTPLSLNLSFSREPKKKVSTGVHLLKVKRLVRNNSGCYQMACYGLAMVSNDKGGSTDMLVGQFFAGHNCESHRLCSIRIHPSADIGVTYLTMGILVSVTSAKAGCAIAWPLGCEGPCPNRRSKASYENRVCHNPQYDVHVRRPLPCFIYGAHLHSFPIPHPTSSCA